MRVCGVHGRSNLVHCGRGEMLPRRAYNYQGADGSAASRRHHTAQYTRVMDFLPRRDEPNRNLNATVPGIINQTQYDEWAMQTVRTIYLSYAPLLIILGAIGNFISMFVFYASKLRLQSTSQYLSALALSDTLFLFQLLFPWLDDIGISGIYNNRGFCQSFTYLSYVTCCTSAWLVVAFTVERFVAVLYPLRRNSMCTVARARYVIAGIAIGATLTNMPVLLFTKSINGHCDIDRDYLEHAARFNIIDTVLSFSLPLVIIVIFNVSIMVGVCRLDRTRHQLVVAEREAVPLHTRPARSVSIPRSQHKITRMLLIVSTVFVILNLPAYTMRVLAYASDKNISDSGGRWFALQQLVVLLFNTNFGINFLLYCLSGQNFRQALYNNLPWVRRRVRRRIALRHAALMQQGGSLTSTSAIVSTDVGHAIAISKIPQRGREKHFIFKCVFDNSRQRHSVQTMPSSTTVSIDRADAYEMRLYNTAARRYRSTSNPYVGTTQF